MGACSILQPVTPPRTRCERRPGSSDPPHENPAHSDTAPPRLRSRTSHGRDALADRLDAEQVCQPRRRQRSAALFLSLSLPLAPPLLRHPVPLPSADTRAPDRPADMYSILLPTYMEYDNIGIIVWLIVTEMEKAGLEFEIIIVGTRPGSYRSPPQLDFQECLCPSHPSCRTWLAVQRLSADPRSDTRCARRRRQPRRHAGHRAEAARPLRQRAHVNTRHTPHHNSTPGDPSSDRSLLRAVWRRSARASSGWVQLTCTACSLRKATT